MPVKGKKQREISSLAKRLLASQEGICSVSPNAKFRVYTGLAEEMVRGSLNLLSQKLMETEENHVKNFAGNCC